MQYLSIELQTLRRRARPQHRERAQRRRVLDPAQEEGGDGVRVPGKLGPDVAGVQRTGYYPLVGVPPGELIGDEDAALECTMKR
jgi:hypothetical protein